MWFYWDSLHDWSRKLAPTFQPIRCKIITNRDVGHWRFPAPQAATLLLIGSLWFLLWSDWPLWSIWFCFEDTPKKISPREESCKMQNSPQLPGVPNRFYHPITRTEPSPSPLLVLYRYKPEKTQLSLSHVNCQNCQWTVSSKAKLGERLCASRNR